MDERTEELRDLFVETTGEESVTEDQREEPGELAGGAADANAEEQVRELIARMRERYDFQSGLGDDELARLVLGFYADEDDAALAEALDVDETTVFDARMDLHLVREGDREAPFDLSTLRELVVGDVPPEERAERLDADPETVEHYTQVVAADLRSTRANDRFTAGFAELLTDADLRENHAADARESGLTEATEDIETNTQL